MEKMKWYWWLFIIVSFILGFSTLVPAPASKPCPLGYYAHCSWTPYSTLICWVIAGGLFWYGKRISKKT